MIPSSLRDNFFVFFYGRMLDEKEESYAQDAKWAVTHSPLVWGLIIFGVRMGDVFNQGIHQMLSPGEYY